MDNITITAAATSPGMSPLERLLGPHCSLWRMASPVVMIWSLILSSLLATGTIILTCITIVIISTTREVLQSHY